MKPDSKSLIRKAGESLEAARLLHDQGHYDFAAGRSYYSMYYMAEAALLEKDSSYSSHRAIHSAFFHEFVETEIVERRHHQSFIRGFQLRQAGDYAGFASVSREQSDNLLIRTNEFLRAISVILNQE